MLVLVLVAVALPLGLWIASSRFARRHRAAGDWDAEGPRNPSGPRWRGPAAIGALLGGDAFIAMHGEPGEVPNADGPGADTATDEAAGSDEFDEVDAEDDEDADTGSGYL
jgi:hypothetical protein